MRIAGLWALVVAVFCISASTTVGAQVRVDTTRADTTRRPGAPPVDSTRPRPPVLDSAAQARAQRRVDSIAAFRRGDTIKAPMARFEMPMSFDADDKLRFNRDQILTSEATNLSELLARVPGVIHYATGWLASAHLASYAGDFRAIRVFMDGLELDANDPRSNGILDLIDVHLFLLDEIVIERTAGEIRVWCRTSTVLRTTPYTRTDVYTGDLNTNGFRALFARRFMNGMALQVNGEQFATQQGRQSLFGGSTSVGKGDGGNQILNARFGFARKKVSFDAYGIVTTRDRDQQAATDSNPPVPAFKGTRREGYVRLGYGDTSSGLWSQAVYSSLRFRLEGIANPENEDTTARSDTTRSREQKMFAIGYRTKSMQLSVTERLRTFNGKSWSSPAVRAAYSKGRIGAGIFAERQAEDSSQHLDANVRIAPLKWLVLSAGHSVRSFDDSTFQNADRRKNEGFTRLEAALNWRNKWFTLGRIQNTDYLQAAPTLVAGAGAPPNLALQGGAYTFGVRGKLFREVGIDMQGTRWDNADALYRPQLSTRTDLFLTTNWLTRFPKGQFGVNWHVIHEYRDPMLFQFQSANDTTKTSVLSQRAQIFTTTLEIRIIRATLFYHFHNVTGQAYELVPGIVMPRQVQFYGVRWEFWN